MKENIYSKLREIDSLTLTEGNGNEIRILCANIAHDVRSMINDFVDRKDGINVRFSETEKLFLTQQILYADLENTIITNKQCIDLIKKVCEL